MANSINYSIIIPNYNTHESLKLLLDTIPCREDIEVIVVDDKSDDIAQYDETAKDYSKKNVKFLKNDTDIKSAGTCRNIGIQNSCGKWLIFADSDDIFLEDSFLIVDQYVDTDYDVIYFCPTSKNLISGETGNRHKSYEEMVNQYLINPNEHNDFIVRTLFCTPWSKMIRRELVITNDIFFDDTICSNDVMFITKTGAFANLIHVTDEKIYCVSEREGSLMSNKKKNISVRRDVTGRYFIFLLKNYSLKYFYMMGVKYNLWRWFSVGRLFLKRNKLFWKALKEKS